jgi:hypothetical protein
MSSSERHDLGGAASAVLRKTRLALSGTAALQHTLGRRRLWPVLPRPRMAGFEMSTEGMESLRCTADI